MCNRCSPDKNQMAPPGLCEEKQAMGACPVIPAYAPKVVESGAAVTVPVLAPKATSRPLFDPDEMPLPRD